MADSRRITARQLGALKAAVTRASKALQSARTPAQKAAAQKKLDEAKQRLRDVVGDEVETAGQPWEVPEFDATTFDWKSIVQRPPAKTKANEEAKKQRLAAAKVRLREKGYTKEQISDILANQALNAKKRARPVLKVDDQEKNAFLEKVFYDEQNYFAIDRLWDLIKDREDNPGVSHTYLSRWLALQQVKQTHAPWQEDNTLQRRTPNGKFPTIQCDLKDMSAKQFGGKHYIFSCVETFTKKLYVRPIADKEGATVAAALRSVLQAIPYDIRLCITDNGSEFQKEFTTVLREKDIQHSYGLPGAPAGQGAVEKSNRTVARLLSMWERQTGGKNWVVELPKLVARYNATRNSVTLMSPDALEKAVRDGNNAVLEQVAERIRENAGFGVEAEPNRIAQLKFEVGDLVHTRLGGGQGLEKSGDRSWSRLPAKIVYREQSKYGPGYVKTRYLLEDSEGQRLYTGQGDEWWYNDMLKKWFAPMKKEEAEEVFVINRILRPELFQRTAQQRVPGYRVTWQGFKGATVEPRDVLEQDIPGYLARFENTNQVVWSQNAQNNWSFQWQRAVRPPVRRKLRQPQAQAAAAANP